MRLVVTLFLASMLVGCSGTYERMAAWIGTSKGAVLAAFDRRPDATGQDALGNWMRWSRQEDGGVLRPVHVPRRQGGRVRLRLRDMGWFLRAQGTRIEA